MLEALIAVLILVALRAVFWLSRLHGEMEHIRVRVDEVEKCAHGTLGELCAIRNLLASEPFMGQQILALANQENDCVGAEIKKDGPWPFRR